MAKAYEENKKTIGSIFENFWTRLGIKAKRKYKNNVFQFVFGKNKKALLELYNALNGTSYTDENEIEYVTIEGALYLTRKNDLAFLLEDTLNMYEHQSTINPNLPVRFFIYLAQEFQKILSAQSKSEYGRKLIKLPAPKCVVFYNGTEKMLEEEKEIKLSDAFEKYTKSGKGIKPDAELTVRVININEGYSEGLKNQCRKLSEYSAFVQKVYEYCEKNKNQNEAINNAIDYCIEHGILEEELRENRSEVLGMLLYEFDKKKYERTIRDEGIEEGKEQQRKEDEKIIMQMNSELSQMSSELTLKDSELSQMSSELTLKDSELSKMSSELMQRDSELAQKNAEISELVERIERLTKK